MKREKIFLIVGSGGLNYIKKHKNYFKKEFGIIFYNLLDKKQKNKVDLNEYESIYSKVFFTDFSDSKKIFKTILEFRDDVVAVNTYGDAGVKFLKKVVPFFPKLKLPTESSLK